MNKKVIIDIGHWESDSGAVGQGFREVDLNISIAKYCTEELKRHGVEVKNTSGSLSNRCVVEKAWGADYFVSIHINAGGGDGTEIFTLSTTGKGREIASKIYDEIVPRLNNGRGLKTANFYVLKNTNAPACLIECAFIDTKDLECIDEEHERKEWGKAIAKGILKQLNIAYKDEVIVKPPANNNLTNSSTTSNVYRIFIDGKQRGTAYANHKNILGMVETALKNNATIIEVKKK